MTHSHRHRHPAPSTVTATDEWKPWSQAWTRHVPRLTDRDDLTVLVEPGAGGGAPACFYSDDRRIEIDAHHIGPPDIADPRRAAHKKLVPTAYGLLIHESAHAAHSRWRPHPTTPPIVVAAADLLEESRAEARHRQRRHTDRRWLNHAVTTLVSADEAPIDDPWHAGVVAALLLARVDARIVTAKHVRAARAAVTTVLGRHRVRQLRDVWRAAHTTDDTDGDAMTELGWRWCEILDISPSTQPAPPQPDPGAFSGQLATAITDYLATALGITSAEYEAQHIERAHAAPASWTERDPTPDEKHAARTLAARLAQARHHDTEPATRATTVPPGRLRARDAITAEAQIAAGAVPTATPWRRRIALPPPKPPLYLAVLVDVSGSMRDYAQPMSSAGWILAHAAHRNDATTTTIAFGDAVTLLIPPRRRPTRVLDMDAHDTTERFIDAVKLADRVLALRRPGGLRILAVVSDGHLVDDDTDAAQHLITTLHRSGCAVLWLRPADLPGHTFTDTTTLTVADPIEAIGHIADAAATALENA